MNNCFSKKLRRPFVVTVLTLALLPVALPAQTVTNETTLAGLHARLDALVNQPRFAGATWSVKIASLDTGRVIYENHADRLVSPASNSKLYTAAQALDTLGGD